MNFNLSDANVHGSTDAVEMMKQIYNNYHLLTNEDLIDQDAYVNCFMGPETCVDEDKYGSLLRTSMSDMRSKLENMYYDNYHEKNVTEQLRIDANVRQLEADFAKGDIRAFYQHA